MTELLLVLIGVFALLLLLGLLINMYWPSDYFSKLDALFLYTKLRIDNVESKIKEIEDGTE